MQNATQIFTVPHGLLSLNFVIELEYKDEELYKLSLNEFALKEFDVVHAKLQEKKTEFDSFAKNVFTQLAQYFMGQCTLFDVPIKHIGTPFQISVWKALQEIPYGQTCSYKNIACAVNSGKAYRAVGMANNQNPIAIIVPCHRVIGANGKLVGYAGGVHIKAALLDLEKHVALIKAN